jgi:hypothetical protein
MGANFTSFIGDSMNTQHIDTSSYAAWRNEAGPGVVAFGMWLRAGFVGASAVAVGLLQMFSGDVKPLSALALTAGGLALAFFSWHRARKSLDAMDDGAAAVEAGPTLRNPVVTS